MMEGKIVSINISRKKGVVKKPVKTALLRWDYGIAGDAHSGKKGSPSGVRQVSLLASETIERWLKKKCASGKIKGGGIKIKPGDFAENVTTKGIDFKGVRPGDTFEIGSASLEVTQIGKPCHSGCAIRKIIGDCVMPREGVFARVTKGGRISVGDRIAVGQVRDKRE
jgi:cyclic pyranopterin phosphate synthase